MNMSIETIAFAAALSALAYWLGHRAGWNRAHFITASLYWRLGVRRVDLDNLSITFSDGSTRTERAP